MSYRICQVANCETKGRRTFNSHDNEHRGNGPFLCDRHFHQMKRHGRITCIEMGPAGFQFMSPQKIKEVATHGNLGLRVKGLAHAFTSDEARAARLSQQKYLPPTPSAL
jgi:hypothetical protein